MCHSDRGLQLCKLLGTHAHRPPRSAARLARTSGSYETRQLESPLIERCGRLTSELEMTHTDQTVRKLRRRVLPDEQRLFDRLLAFDLQLCRLKQPRERPQDLGFAQAITAAQYPLGLE